MLENALRDDLLLNETMQLWKHQPDGYVQTASARVFVLISRKFAPPAVRLRDAIAREEQIPRLFAQARANLTAVDKDTASIAYRGRDRQRRAVREDRPAAFAGAGDAAARARFRRSTATAIAATKAFAAYLRTRWVAHPSGTYAIGAANYSARLKYEEGDRHPARPRTSRSVRRRSRRRTPRWSRPRKRIDPHATTEQVLARLYKVHPSSANLLAAAQGDLVKLRAFIIAHRIIDLPPDADIKVTRDAGVPARDDRGVDGLRPARSSASRRKRTTTSRRSIRTIRRKVHEQYLEAFNDFERPIISAHEVYPGHFVNFTIDKHLPLTLSEKLLTRQLVRRRLGALRRADDGRAKAGATAIRACGSCSCARRSGATRAASPGVKMHTQGMTVAQAEQLFRTQAFLDPGQRARGGQTRHAGCDLRLLHARQAGDPQAARRLQEEAGQRVHARALPPRPLAVRRSARSRCLRPLLLGADDDGKILPDM